MALYSVWNWDRNNWEVYRDARPVSVGVDSKPPKPSDVNTIGVDPDTQMNPLPSDARFMGYDHTCRGEIRVAPKGALSGLGAAISEAGGTQKFVAGMATGIVLYLIYKGAQ